MTTVFVYSSFVTFVLGLIRSPILKLLSINNTILRGASSDMVWGTAPLYHGLSRGSYPPHSFDVLPGNTRNMPVVLPKN
eukprot:scaffold381104_cov79-Cyclotella_meneghiniana.AAC.2